MATAFLDAFSGLSGDMMVGALVDLGADREALKAALASLPLDGYRLSFEPRSQSGISAIKFNVEVTAKQQERKAAAVLEIIAGARLPAGVSQQARHVIELLAEAEAKVHRVKPEEVHFHEVGAVDSIIDVVAAVWCLHALEVSELLVSPLPAGSGFVASRHGMLPVPAPATAELLSGFSLRLGDGAGEMVTPTGAALLKALARPAPEACDFVVERVGYGAGARALDDRPNVLRVLLGRLAGATQGEELVQIETNIDDLNPQLYEHLAERLFAQGARDVTLTPTLMKKGRPGVIVAVLTQAAVRQSLIATIFNETSTIGVRFHPVSRLSLRRALGRVTTRFGEVRVKVSGTTAAETKFAPEYEDCKRQALEHQVPLRQVMEEAAEAARAGRWSDEPREPKG